MLLQRGVRIGVLLALVQLGLSACSNGGTAIGSSSSTDGSGNASSVSSSSQQSSKSSKSSASSSMSSVVSSVSSSKSSSSSSMTSSSSRSSVSSSSSSSRSSSSSSSSSSMSSSSSAASSSSVSGNLSIRVDGKDFKDASGNVIQLRGVNLEGMEFTAIGGWSINDPFPQLVESNWTALHNWKVNIIRIPLNEDSYLGLTCVNKNNVTENADPGGNYKTRLKQVVDRATSEGFYVILDLHWTAPNDSQRTINGITAQCAEDQNPVADADHSIDFWTGVAQSYKGYGNVMFELFNEPFIGSWGSFTGAAGTGRVASWQGLRDGVTYDSYVPQYTTSEGHYWQTAGMQAMINAIRNTGATNVVLESGLQWSQILDSWLDYKVTDPLNQLAAVWHAYPTFGAVFGTLTYSLPNFGEDAYTWAQNILSAGYPVIVTEFGDQDSPGTVGAPFASALLPRLDAMNVSYLGWTFTVSGESSNILIKDNNGTPTDGYGVYVKAHYICRDAGTANCP